MSGGTPVGGGGHIRQRHGQGYASGGNDLEDDACSRSQPFALDSPRSKTWVEILENVFWIASAVFIVYFGYRHSNMIYILLHDARIKRKEIIDCRETNFAHQHSSSLKLMPQSEIESPASDL